MPVTKHVRYIQRFIWLYFWLLIFEGVLRKWLLPGLSVPLLIVRDPVLLLAYFYAFRCQLLPDNRFTRSTLALALLSFPAGLVATVYTDFSNISVVLFGLRTNFLHLPLIFLIPKVFDRTDVLRFGRVVLLLALPMALLMAAQFAVGPEAFLNRGAGEDASQIISVFGRIRPAGTFSFVNGTSLFFALSTASLLYGFLQPGVYSRPLLTAAGFALPIALAVSGSRSTILGVALVFAAMFVGLLLQPRLARGAVRVALFIGFAGLSLSFLPTFNEALNVTTTRLELASTAEGGLAQRFIGSYQDTFNGLLSVPLLGYGLGMGTNAGAALLGLKGRFLLAEAEWPRVVRESGPILGFGYILLRLAIAVWMGKLALRCVSTGNLLPLLSFAACGLNIISGQFGQPTSLGFAVFGGGLCLAAMRVPVVLESYESSAGRQLSTR